MMRTIKQGILFGVFFCFLEYFVNSGGGTACNVLKNENVKILP